MWGIVTKIISLISKKGKKTIPAESLAKKLAIGGKSVLLVGGVFLDFLDFSDFTGAARSFCAGKWHSAPTLAETAAKGAFITQAMARHPAGFNIIAEKLGSKEDIPRLEESLRAVLGKCDAVILDFCAETINDASAAIELSDSVFLDPGIGADSQGFAKEARNIAQAHRKEIIGAD